MTNYPIDGALAAEGAFEIDLLNKVTGTTYPRAAVYARTPSDRFSRSMPLTLA